MGKLENPIQDAIYKYLCLRRIYCWRNNNVGVWDNTLKIYRKPHNTLNGLGDIEGMWKNGRFLSIEVKAKTDLSEDQKAHIIRINKDGGLAFQARSILDVEIHLLADDFVYNNPHNGNIENAYQVILDKYWVKNSGLYKDIEMDALDKKDVTKMLIIMMLKHEDYEIEDGYKAMKNTRSGLWQIYKVFLENKIALKNFLEANSVKKAN